MSLRQNREQAEPQQAPLRPALPVLLIPLAAAWAGICLAAELCYRAQGPEPALLVAATLAAAGITVATLRTTRRLAVRVVVLTLLALVCGLTSGRFYYGEIEQSATMLSTNSATGAASAQIELVIVEDTQVYPNSRGSEALVQQAFGLTRPGGSAQDRFRVYWSQKDLELPKGTHLSANVSTKPLTPEQRWYFDRGIVGTLTLTSIQVQGFGEGIWGGIDQYRWSNVERLSALGGQGAALTAGVLLGYRELLASTAAEQDFVTCGLTHLVAVSGSHLAVVAALLAWVLKKLPFGRRGELVCLIAALALYVMFTGLQPSAIRSAIMAGVGGASFLVGRRGHAPSALAAAALGMLLVYPPNAYSLGFWLSVFAVLGITLFGKLATTWLCTLTTPRAKSIMQAAAVTICAQAATLPLAVPTFGVFSLISPLANILVAPLVSAVLSLGMIALVCLPVFEPASQLLMSVSSAFSEIAIGAANLLAQVPYASMPLEFSLVAAVIIGLVIAAVLHRAWPHPRPLVVRSVCAALGALLCVAAFVLPASQPPQLVVMNIGQGDALLIREQGHAVLIDTGPSDSALTHALARQQVSSLDAVIITHLDADHAEALSRLRGLVNVGAVYFAHGLIANKPTNQYLRDASELVGAQNVGELTPGATLSLGTALKLTVLWPQKAALEGSNAESVCVLLTVDTNGDGINEHQALLVGDAEEQEIAGILKAYPELWADIYKVGHHGSRDAITVEQLTKLRSELSLMSVGANNRYGHPTEQTLEVLAQAGTTVLRTDEQGDICLSFERGALTVHYQQQRATLF